MYIYISLYIINIDKYDTKLNQKGKVIDKSIIIKHSLILFHHFLSQTFPGYLQYTTSIAASFPLTHFWEEEEESEEEEEECPRNQIHHIF